MICPHCKHEIDSASLYCPVCGQTISNNNSNSSSDGFWCNIPKQGKAEKRNSGKSGILGYIIVAAIVILLGGYGMIQVINKDQNEIIQKENPSNEIDEFEEIDTEQYTDTTITNDTHNNESEEYVLPESNIEYLSENDLYGFTAEECRLARNEIYARHGRKFKDEFLQEYFNSKSWYDGTVNPDDFQESWLNEYEIANRDLILQYEELHGY